MEPAVEEFIYWRLVSDPRTAVWFGFRVTPVVGEQGASMDENGDIVPFATYRRINVNREVVFDLSTSDAPVIQVAVDSYAGTYEQAKGAAAAVLAVLHKATEPAFGSKIMISLHKTEQDDVGVPVNGKEVPIYSVTQTFELTIEE